MKRQKAAIRYTWSCRCAFELRGACPLRFPSPNPAFAALHMHIDRLTIRNLRNLKQVSLSPCPGVNVIFGANGSGKTSLLEAISLLLSGRSFRQQRLKPLVADGETECLVVGDLIGQEGRHRLGIRRAVSGPPLIKLDGSRVTALASLVRHVPVQVLDFSGFDLIGGAPKIRRRYIDWGLFHVEHEFFAVWQLAQRALKQRNQLLRHGKIDHSLLNPWSREYARHGKIIAAMRARYLENLLPLAEATLARLSPPLAGRVEVKHYGGWPANTELDALLVDSAEGDARQGFTRFGPHRAELQFRVEGVSAGDVLSRGQLKLLAAAMRIAQVSQLHSQSGTRSLMLIDDLGAELDCGHRAQLCDEIERLGMQAFVTCVDRHDVKDDWSKGRSAGLFHVEHGAIHPFREGC